MKFHPSVKPAIWGAVGGSVVMPLIGFSLLGWTLGSTAEHLASDRADTAVVGVLSPMCVEKFQQQADSAARLIEFRSAASWARRGLIEKGGWATSLGTDKTNLAVIRACAERLGQLS